MRKYPTTFDLDSNNNKRLRCAAGGVIRRRNRQLFVREQMTFRVFFRRSLLLPVCVLLRARSQADQNEARKMRASQPQM